MVLPLVPQGRVQRCKGHCVEVIQIDHKGINGDSLYATIAALQQIQLSTQARGNGSAAAPLERSVHACKSGVHAGRPPPPPPGCLCAICL